MSSPEIQHFASAKTSILQRLPAELRLIVYRLIDDSPLKLEADHDKLNMYLCSRDQRVGYSISPKTLISLSRVSHFFRQDMGGFFLKGRFDLEGVMQQSTGLFAHPKAMWRFALLNKQVAKMLKVALLFGWNEALHEPSRNGITEHYWISHRPRGSDFIWRDYPALEKLGLVAATFPLNRIHFHPLLPAGFMGRAEGAIKTWYFKKTVDIVVYRYSSEIQGQ